MSQLPPADQSPQAASAAAPVTEPGFEAALQTFWEKNRSLIAVACAAALLAIVIREGWQYFSAQHEKGVQEEYAKVADVPDKLAAFAEANSGHALAGVAWLRLADEKFSAADYKPALANYQKAAGSLKNEALIGRARLGAAMSQLSGGDQAAGEAALKALGADQSLLKGVRAEALYHQASLAFAAGKTDETRKLVDEIGKVDPAGAWLQRASVLLATTQTESPPAATTAPAISFKPTGK